MTTTVLLAFAAALLSIVFRYVPGSDGWWANQPPVAKRGLMAVFVILAGVIIYGSACLGFLEALNWNLACNESGMQQIISLVMAALVNQGTYKLIEPKKE